MCSCRWAWQGWHFVTFDVLQPECVCVCVRDRCGRKVAMSMGKSHKKAAKTRVTRHVRRCIHVVLRGRRGTLWHSMCFTRIVCARPSWQKICRVMGEATQTCLSRRVRRCACRFAWQVWHFVTFDVFQEDCVCATIVAENLPCHGGSHTNVSFSTCQKTCSCRWAWHAWHFVTFDVFQEEWESHQNVSFSTCQKMCMSFCVAGVALCDIRCVSGGHCVCATVVRVKLAWLWGKPQKTCLSRRVRRRAHVV